METKTKPKTPTAFYFRYSYSVFNQSFKSLINHNLEHRLLEVFNRATLLKNRRLSGIVARNRKGDPIQHRGKSFMHGMTGIMRAARKTVTTVAGVLLAGSLAMAGAQAQDRQVAAATSKSNKIFTVVVFGDSLADGLWAGLYQYFLPYRGQVRVLRETKVSSGFTAFNYQARLEQILARTKPDLFVVQTGANDRQRMVTRSRKLIRFNTDPWKAIYRERLDLFLARLKKANIPTYWVGLPIMRDQRIATDSKMLNGLYKAATLGHGFTYISSWEVTANKKGVYSAFMPDAKGRLRRFRADDGIHFSMIGYGVVARHVMSVVKASRPNLLARLSSN